MMYLYILVYDVYDVWTTIVYVVFRCESVHKVIECVFGMMEKWFRILKIPLPYYDIFQVTDIVHLWCILHNMILEDKGRISIGHLVDDWILDWIDKDPDTSKVRREICEKDNGRVFLLNGCPYITNDTTDYFLYDNQYTLTDWFDDTNQCDYT
jgi:hypothetical protein